MILINLISLDASSDYELTKPRWSESFMPDFGSDGISIDTISGVASITLLGGLLGIDVGPHAGKFRVALLEVEARLAKN